MTSIFLPSAGGTKVINRKLKISSFVGKANFPAVVAVCVEDRGHWRRNTHIQNSAERHSRVHTKHFKRMQISRLVFEIFTKEFSSDLLLPVALPLLEGQCSIKTLKKVNHLGLQKSSL